jgi:hypothetical protein
MNSINLKSKVDGSVALVLGEIITGIVVLFIGVFMLGSIEPMFGNLQVCTYGTDLGTPQLLLNGTLAESKNMSFTPTAVVSGTCQVHLLVTNMSNGTAGSYLEVREGGTPTTLLANITAPVLSSWTAICGVAGVTAVAKVVNITAFGRNNLTVNSTSYIYCCNALVNRPGPAGQLFQQVVATAAVAFTVFGLVLVCIGLATAIGSLKNMF